MTNFMTLRNSTLNIFRLSDWIEHTSFIRGKSHDEIPKQRSLGESIAVPTGCMQNARRISRQSKGELRLRLRLRLHGMHHLRGHAAHEVDTRTLENL